MNSKGYTLVELLVVISILIIVGFIASSGVNYVLNIGKEEAFKINVSEIMESLSLEIADSNLNPETLNNMTVFEVFDFLGIDGEINNYESIQFYCLNIENSVCKKFSVEAVGKNKWSKLTITGTRTNLIVEKS